MWNKTVSNKRSSALKQLIKSRQSYDKTHTWYYCQNSEERENRTLFCNEIYEKVTHSYWCDRLKLKLKLEINQ